MKTLKVKVTQEDIDRGLTDTAEACPIAIALQRMGYVDASVGWRTFFLKYRAKSILLPDKAASFVDDFDHHFEVEPFEFEVELPE